MYKVETFIDEYSFEFDRRVNEFISQDNVNVAKISFSSTVAEQGGTAFIAYVYYYDEGGGDGE